MKGKSDHSPIIVESHNPISKGQAKWKSKNVNWQPFKEDLETQCYYIQPMSINNIIERNTRLINMLTEVGKNHLGKVNPGKNTKSQMTPQVRAAIRR